MLIHVITSVAFSADPCDFKLKCKNNGKEFFLTFKSASGDCTEDDMELFAEFNQTSEKIDFKKEWYAFTDNVSKTQTSLCKDATGYREFAAYSVGKNLALLFVKSSGRPGYDKVNAILFDTSSQKVVDSKMIGLSKNSFVAVLKHNSGFKVRIVRNSISPIKEVNCDCDAMYVDDWMFVSVAKGKLAADWVR